MPSLLSEDFVRNKLAKQMAGRAERVFRDSKLTGFVLRVRRGGGNTLLATWFIEQPAPGKKNPRKVVIGDHPTFTAPKARELAQAMLQAVKRGDDPAAERAAKRTQPRWEDLVAAFQAKHLPKVKASTAGRYTNIVNRILTPAFTGRRIADITTAQIAAVHARKAATPADANNALRVLGKMMAFAVGEGMRSTNPAIGISRFAGRIRDRWLDENELPKFLGALAEETDACADLIRFLTVTGWRVSDARLLDWAQVDLKSREVALMADSATKKRPRVLSADAAVLVDRQPGRLGSVFTRYGTESVGYAHLCERLRALCTKAGIAPITPHTLRHSAATWAAIHGGDIVELRDAFGWSGLEMPARYIKTSRITAHRGAERAASAINIFGKPSAEITGFAREKRS
jgi:integrase